MTTNLKYHFCWNTPYKVEFDCDDCRFYSRWLRICIS